MRRTRYVIIGITQAGLAAAETIRSLDRDAVITVLSGDPFPVSARRLVAVSACPWSAAGAERPAFRGNDFFSRFDITVRSGIGVERIDPSRRVVSLAGGGSVAWDRLLLATGNATSIPAIERAGSWGRVRFLSRLADIRYLGEDLGKGLAAVIAGTGYLAVKAAESLLSVSRSVTVVHPDADGFSFVPDAEVRRLAATALDSAGVELVPGERVTALEPLPAPSGREDSDEVRLAALSGGRTLPCGVLVVIPDSRPDVRLALGAGLSLNRGIMVNGRLETSVEGIYAAGECAAVFDRGRDRDGLTDMARVGCRDTVRQGRVAAMRMVESVSAHARPGPVSPYGSAPVLGSLDFFGLLVNFCGTVNPPFSGGWQIRTDSSGSTVDKPKFRKFVLRGDRLAGFILVNAPERCGYYKNFIERRRSVRESALFPSSGTAP